MAKPQSKTTVSVLRSIIGISAKELAELTGRSIHTIKSVESGRLALSDELAIKISVETGVCAQWLVDSDPQAPPLNDLPIPPGHPSGLFNKKYFEERRDDRTKGRDELNRSGGSPILSARLRAIQAAAMKTGNSRSVDYRMSKFLGELEKEFGRCEKTLGLEVGMIGQLMEFETLFSDPDGGRDDKTGEPKWATCGERADYREFVPAFTSTHAKLEKVSKKRHEKHNPQEPGIFPLLEWAWETIQIIAPKRAAQIITQGMKDESRSKTGRRSAKSPA